jgi:hypothetical protein
MKKLLMFLMFAALMFFGFVATNVTYAAETTEEVTTEETTENAVENEGLDIYVDDDGAVYIDGVKLTKEQLLQITYEALEENFGSQIATVSIVVVVAVLALLGFGTFGTTRITQNIRATRELKKTNDGVVGIKDNVNENSDAIYKLEARAAKSQALESLVLEGLSLIMANSSNEKILGSAATYKEKVDKALQIKDDVGEALKKVADSAKAINETSVGETVKNIKVAKKKIINSMLDEE